MDILSLKPEDTPDYMIPAWLSCIHWASGKPEIIDAFREETGFRWQPGQTAIDRMVDDATGMPQAFAEAFVRWANVAIWGSLESSK